MNLKLTMKQTLLTASIAATLVLGGCSSHQNPLETHESTQVAKFLVHASQTAQKKITPDNTRGSAFSYGYCMTGKTNAQHCTKLYRAMIDFAKTTQNFKTLTLEDLTNPKAFDKLKGDYNNQAFVAI